MIRETLAANARSALVDLTPSNGLEFIRRSTVAGSTTTTPVARHHCSILGQADA
jgi:hypothetical protein